MTNLSQNIWNLNPKKQKDPSRNDTYLIGADFSLNFPFLNQIALGTGFGLRLDYESIVIRLNFGIGYPF